MKETELKHAISDFDNGTIFVPDKGEYNLIATEIGETHKIIIDKQINSDTLNKPRIEEYIKLSNVSFKKGTSKEN